MAARYPLFVKRDIDGFFGLAIDNLVQLLAIVFLCGTFCGMSGDDASFIYRHILPGAGVSLLIGNLFYAFQAVYVARRDGRSDVTALPYGINTPSVLVYVFFVMMPAYRSTGDPAVAWRLGLIACLGSGIIELAGAFFAERLRRNTPRAALLSTLAGIAIAFISMTFALQIWQRPLVAIVPMAIVLAVYFAHVRFPLGLPGGLIAVLTGTALAWLLNLLGLGDGRLTAVTMSAEEVRTAWEMRGTYLPLWAGPEIAMALREHGREILPLLSIIIPMGLFNVVGSLQNIESAEAGGDVFATGPSLGVNGVGTIAAAFFGSCFPTTIYIGHPGWKAMGARSGYSTLNAIFMTAICLTGTVALISNVVPMEAGIAIVFWIGIVITAQAFQATPVRHAPAVAIGLFPAIAAWGAIVMLGAFDEANRDPVDASWPRTIATAPAPGAEAVDPPDTDADPGEGFDAAPGRLAATTAQDLLESSAPTLGEASAVNGFFIHGLNIMERGFIFTCMIMSAVAAFLIDRRFGHAAAWSLAAAVLTLFGLMHAYQLKGNTLDFLPLFTAPADGAFAYRAFPIAIGYALMAGLFALIARRERGRDDDRFNTLEDARVAPLPGEPEDVPPDDPART